ARARAKPAPAFRAAAGGLLTPEATMNCNHVHALVTPYVDGEMEPRQTAAIERHLRGCAGCTASYREMNELRRRIRTQVPRFVASPELHARVRAMAGALRAAEASPTPRERDRRRWLASGAFAGGLAMVVAWAFGTAVMTSVASADFAIAAVASHVDATLGDRLIQVASSDRHTVKPWLSARLDYSPPVNDLVDEG